MLLGYFTGVSGIRYNAQNLDVTSNNMANVKTTGFKRSYYLARSRKVNPYTHLIDSQVKRRMPDYYGIQRSGIFKDHDTEGSYLVTENPNDVAIAPELSNAFFAVRRHHTDIETCYTRNGDISFQPINPNNPHSTVVLYLGNNIALNAEQQPIHIDATQGDLKISPEGILRQDDTIVGELPIFRFNQTNDPLIQRDANLQLLHQLGESTFLIPEESKDNLFPQRIVVGHNGVSRLVNQGFIEGSNVNIIREMTDMMAITKAAEANARAMNEHVESLSKLFHVIRT